MKEIDETFFTLNLVSFKNHRKVSKKNRVSFRTFFLDNNYFII